MIVNEGRLSILINLAWCKEGGLNFNNFLPFGFQQSWKRSSAPRLLARLNSISYSLEGTTGHRPVYINVTAEVISRRKIDVPFSGRSTC